MCHFVWCTPRATCRPPSQQASWPTHLSSHSTRVLLRQHSSLGRTSAASSPSSSSQPVTTRRRDGDSLRAAVGWSAAEGGGSYPDWRATKEGGLWQCMTKAKWVSQLGGGAGDVWHLWSYVELHGVLCTKWHKFICAYLYNSIIQPLKTRVMFPCDSNYWSVFMCWCAFARCLDLFFCSVFKFLNAWVLSPPWILFVTTDNLGFPFTKWQKEYVT